MVLQLPTECCKCLKRKRKNNEYNTKYYLCPYTGDIATLKEVIINSKLIDWNCTFCNENIKASTVTLDASNLVCSNCYKKYIKDHAIVPRAILKPFMMPLLKPVSARPNECNIWIKPARVPIKPS